MERSGEWHRDMAVFLEVKVGVNSSIGPVYAPLSREFEILVYSFTGHY